MNLSKGMPLIPFIFPFNVYVIGDSIGSGFQFLLVRIIETIHGRSVIFLWQELGLVLDGTITSGRTVSSILIWIGGAILLGTAAVLYTGNRSHGRYGIRLYSLGCIILIVSTMVQYGPLFNGPAGIAIPIGLPPMVLIGYLLWRDVSRSDQATEHYNGLAEQDDTLYAGTHESSINSDVDVDDQSI